MYNLVPASGVHARSGSPCIRFGRPRPKPKHTKNLAISAFRRHGEDNPLNKTYQFWQNMNSPMLLHYNKLIDQKTEYIHQNPVKAGFVEEPFDWYYSSAHPDNPMKTFDF